MPVSRAGVAGTKQKKRLQWRDKKGCCRSCVIWAKMASIDRERSRVFRPRRHSQPQPELARAAVVSHTSQSVLQGPKWAPGLCVQGGSRERTRRVLLFPLFGFFFLVDFDRFR